MESNKFVFIALYSLLILLLAGSVFAINQSIIYKYPESTYLNISNGVVFKIVFNTTGNQSIDWQEYSSNPVYNGSGRAYYPELQTLIDGTKVLYYTDYTTDYVISRVITSNYIQFSNQTLDVINISGLSHSTFLADISHYLADDYYEMWLWNVSANIYATGTLLIIYSKEGFIFINPEKVNMPFLGNVSMDWTRGSYGAVHTVFNKYHTNVGTDPRNYAYMVFYDATDGSHEATGLMYCTNETDCHLYGQITYPDVTYSSKVYGEILRDYYGLTHYYYGCGSTPHKKMCHATSVNGIDNFTEDINNPIITTQAGTWRNDVAGIPAVIKENKNIFHMLLEGRPLGGNYVLGYYNATQNTNNYSIKWYVNGTEQISIENETSFDFSNTNFSGGTYNITAKVISSSGEENSTYWIANLSGLSLPVLLSYTPTDLNFSIAEPNNQTFSINWTDADNLTDIIYWYVNGTLVQINMTNQSQINYTWFGNYSIEGIYNITVIVSDGQLNASNTWIMVVNNTIIPSPPTLNGGSSTTEPLISGWNATQNISVQAYLSNLLDDMFLQTLKAEKGLRSFEATTDTNTRFFSIYGNPKDIVLRKIFIKNTGDIDLSLRLFCQGDLCDYIFFDKNAIKIKANTDEMAIIPLAIKIPSWASYGEDYNFTLILRDMNEQDLGVQFNGKVYVNKFLTWLSEQTSIDKLFNNGIQIGNTMIPNILVSISSALLYFIILSLLSFSIKKNKSTAINIIFELMRWLGTVFIFVLVTGMLIQ